MLIMADVTSEMGAELRASAMAAGTSVAAEVGRRLERLERLEATVEAGSNVDGLGSIHPVTYRFAERLAAKSEADVLCNLLRQAEVK
jgi:hypothetical protein